MVKASISQPVLTSNPRPMDVRILLALADKLRQQLDRVEVIPGGTGVIPGNDLAEMSRTLSTLTTTMSTRLGGLV